MNVDTVLRKRSYSQNTKHNPKPCTLKELGEGQMGFMFGVRPGNEKRGSMVEIWIKIHTVKNPYLFAVFGKEFISRNHMKKRIKRCVKVSSWIFCFNWALFGKGFSSRNHQIRRMKNHS